MIPKPIKKSPLNDLARQKHVAVFLDFDGTLSPLVSHPTKARLSPKIKPWLKKIAAHKDFSVAIISGRDLTTVRKKVGLSHLIYAGNHGYEIKFPNKPLFVHPVAKRAKKIISALHKKLENNLKGHKGAFSENKGLSLSLHTRMANKKTEIEAHKIFYRLVNPYKKKRRVRITVGKKVLEVRPPYPSRNKKWNKGTALLYILKKLKGRPFPLYMGDDRTDEDAFKVLRKRGLGVRVGKTKKTSAHLQLKNIAAVPTFLRQLILRRPRV